MMLAPVRLIAVAVLFCAVPNMAMAQEAAPTLKSLTIAVRNASAVREIKSLQHRWAQLADVGDWRAMADLFAPDGIKGDLEGREAIYAALRDSDGDGHDGLAPDRLNIRLFLSPVITIGPRGTTAKGRWHEIAMLGHYGESAEWRGGIHEINYVRGDGGWTIAHDQYYPQYAGPYSDGWRSVSEHVPLAPYHYNNPTRVGTPFDTYIAKADTMSAGDIARDAQALLDASAVQNLQAAYGFYVDRGMWPDAADLFTQDANYNVGGELMRQGRRGILAALTQDGKEGLERGILNNHLQLMPVVTVAPDGKTATARGFEFLAVSRPDGSSAWGLRIFDNEYVKSDGIWKISGVTLHPRFLTDYDKGWAVDAGPQADTTYPKHNGPKPDFSAAMAATGNATQDIPLAELARMIAVAQAYDGAENVSNAYGYYIDEFRWDDTADLFARDGWKELSYIGAYHGREHVRGSLFARYGDGGRRSGFMAIHQKTQPFVTVAPDGKSAQIRLQLFQFNSASATPGSYIFGIYENQVKLEDGVWKIAGMDLDYVVLANYMGGWTAVEPGSSKRYAPTPESVAVYPPDGPLRGVQFAPFPDIVPMGFHYTNPVSGRAPAVKLEWRVSTRHGESVD